MKVKELLPGDRVQDCRNGKEYDFEVLATEAIGQLIRVTFHSCFGLASASYNGNAFIAARR